MGHGQKEFHVHKQIIGRLSPALDALVNGKMKEAQEGRVYWPDTTTDTFVRFASFAYSNDYQAAEPQVIAQEQESAPGPVASAAEATESGVNGKETGPNAGGHSASSTTLTQATMATSTNPPPHPPVDTESIDLSATDSDDSDSDSLSDLSDSEVDDVTPPLGMNHAEWVNVLAVDDDSEIITIDDDFRTGQRRPNRGRSCRVQEAPTLPYSISTWMDQYKAAKKRALVRAWSPNSKWRAAAAECTAPGKRRRDIEDIYYDDFFVSSDDEVESEDDDDDFDDDDLEDNDDDYGSVQPIPHEDHHIEDRHRMDRHLSRTGHRGGHGYHTQTSHHSTTPPAPNSDWTDNALAEAKNDAMHRFLHLCVDPSRETGPSRNMTALGSAATTTTSTTPQNNSSSEHLSQIPVLLSHATLYILADTYGIDSLRELSLGRLHDCLLHYQVTHLSVPDLTSLTDTIFDNTVEEDKARTVMVCFWVCFLEQVSSTDEFKELLRMQGDFAASLMESVTLRLEPQARPKMPLRRSRECPSKA